MTGIALSSDARRFGQMFYRVELSSLLSNPTRPYGLVILFTPVLIVLITWLATVLIAPSPLTWLMAVVLYVVGVVVAGALTSLTCPGVEARAFSSAPHKWLLSVERGSAGAYARMDRNGRLTLYSVWASPQGKQIGSILMRQILADAPQETDLWLVAVNNNAACFYKRFGFVRVSRGLMGIRMVHVRRSKGA